jgi:hypothetical protein
VSDFHERFETQMVDSSPSGSSTTQSTTGSGTYPSPDSSGNMQYRKSEEEKRREGVSAHSEAL